MSCGSELLKSRKILVAFATTSSAGRPLALGPASAIVTSFALVLAVLLVAPPDDRAFLAGGVPSSGLLPFWSPPVAHCVAEAFCPGLPRPACAGGGCTLPRVAVPGLATNVERPIALKPLTSFEVSDHVGRRPWLLVRKAWAAPGIAQNSVRPGERSWKPASL